MARRLLAELLGTGLLVAAVVGSGILAVTLTDNVALVLLMNTLATVAALGVLIWVLGPISGAHFNPAVSAVAAVRREISWPEASAYVVVQFVGAVAGATLANIMFGLAPWSQSGTIRTGTGVWLGEIVATGGLLLVIGALTRTGHARLGPALVPAWIGAACLFTASTSFANPAVTLGRAFTDTFTGIAWQSVPMFIAFQLVGAAVGAGLTEVLYPSRHPQPLDLPGAVHDR